MKSVLSWLLLLIIYVTYLVIGGFLFHTTECPHELEDKRAGFDDASKLSLTILDLKQKLNGSDEKVLETVLNHLENSGNSVVFSSGDNANVTKCSKWDYENSLFFAFTVVTTIGYGHQAPTTPQGRMVCLVYAIIGIPLNAILIGSLGSVFSDKFKQYKKKLWQGLGRGESPEHRPKVIVVIVETVVFIFFFTSILMLIPAAIFTALENDGDGSWDFHNSFYYTFITLSTIGFGDMVPDRQENKHLKSAEVRWLYLIGIILWIIIGMGYIFAVVDVLAETLKSTSKPVKKAWRGLKNQMHVTDYWKKIINEIILIKESDIKIDDSDILVGGGGSEPCLVLPDGDGGKRDRDDVYDIRKAVSANNVQEVLDNSFQLELDQRRLSNSNELIVKKDSVIRVSDNFLTVPGGHRRTRASTPSSGSDSSNYEELNEDTITSLRQFVAVAKIGQSAEEWAENNLPSWTRARADSVDNGARRVSLGRTVSLNTEAGSGVRVERRPSTKSTLSRSSTRSAISGPVGALLEQTTLGEFMAAVESVRRKSHLELPGTAETSVERSSSLRLGGGLGRRPSFLQRIMAPSRRGSGSNLVSLGAGDTREAGSGEETDTGHHNQSYINYI